MSFGSASKRKSVFDTIASNEALGPGAYEVP
jgi:hypothetical protein